MSLVETFKSVLCPIHKEGHLFIGIGVIATLIAFATEETLGWVFLVITCWIVYFFRDPDRTTPEKEGLIVATGDGKICAIEKATPPPELGLGDIQLTRISIFLNVFNVHVNRTPIAGKITACYYHPGKFLNASLDKASDENERQSAIVETKGGKQVIFVQIAGLVARRIVCYLRDEQEVKAGERFGIIRFGSRCDIYLPEGVNPLVCVGQTTVGGETIIAAVNSSEPAMEGNTH